MDFEQKIFGQKSFSDLLKNIYDNSREKEKQIKDLISGLKPLVTDTQSALMVVPLIKEYLDVSVKNDDSLIKMAGIVQRAMNNNGGDNSDFLRLVLLIIIVLIILYFFWKMDKNKRR